MDFCPKCGTLLVPNEKKENSLLCNSCGYSPRAKFQMALKEKVNRGERAKGVSEKQEETMAKVHYDCQKCGHNECYYWTEQTRASDEPETQFFRCVKCSHTHREYE